LSGPEGIVFDGGGNAYVTDGSNNRALEYLQPTTSVSASRTLALANGWNLLSLTSGTAYTASSIVNQIDAQGGSVSMLATYRAGSFRLYVPGYSSDLSIGSDVGFWVLATQSSVWTEQ
jgi:hypothetical protein